MWARSCVGLLKRGELVEETNTVPLRNTRVMVLAFFLFSLVSGELYAATCDRSSSKHESCLTKSEVKDYVKHIVNQAQAAGKKRNSFQVYCDIINQHVDLEEVAHFVGAAFWSQVSEDQKIFS